MQEDEVLTRKEQFWIALRMLWFIWAHFAGMASIALAAGYGIVQSVAGDDQVMISSEVRDEMKSVQVHGRLSFTVDLERLEACNGEIVTIWSTTGKGNPAVITTRKPSTYTDVKKYPDIRVTNPVPENVFPGRWRIATSLVSQCPTRVWTDLLYTLEVDVTP